MKKALLWSMIPLRNEMSAEEILARNRIGSNSGNVLFHTSMARALTLSPDGIPDTCFFAHRDDLDRFAQEVNERYRCFVMPLANAFRANYMPRLRELTRFIRKLRIPCVVAGVGIQASSVEELRRGFPFDEDVRSFMNAVLERSAAVGVRGAFTAEYLRRLGYIEDRDFAVIGCPSMYSRGDALPLIKPMPNDENARVCVNGKADSAPEIRAFTMEGCRLFPNYTYVAQNIEEMWLLRAGLPVLPTTRRLPPKYVPATRLNHLMRESRAVGYLNARSWISAMVSADFCFGCNIHGNVAAILSGAPALVLAKDLRVAELAEYHEIPLVTLEEMRGGLRFEDAIARANWHSVSANHPARFRKFVNFLNINNLEHIYVNGKSPSIAPYDLALAETVDPEPLLPHLHLSRSERAALRPVYEKAHRYYADKVGGKLREKLPMGGWTKLPAPRALPADGLSLQR
ncbi:MAG: polysaccharide pyruvyl transferase family protein [Clostridia bacterium]|nr:polysaccharide pyruvyl transferase family protein [Clostridia bacterium]